MPSCGPAGVWSQRPAAHSLRDTLPFPVRLTGAESALPRQPISRLVQGTSWQEQLLGDYAVALSSLSRAQPRRPLLHGLRGSELNFDACSAWQRRALQRAAAALDPMLQDLPQESESAALSDILHSDDLYTLTGGAALGTYDISRLRVARGDIRAKEVVGDVASTEATVFIRDPATHNLKSDAELAADVDAGVLRGKPH